MSNYHQSDSLFTDTNLPMSGTGSSTPEPAARNADYTAWPWEVMLATVLDIAAPDRGEVTGQPWLTVLRDGQNPGGAHLIWTASWDTSPQSGATSVQVYLNPALVHPGRRLGPLPQRAAAGPGQRAHGKLRWAAAEAAGFPGGQPRGCDRAGLDGGGSGSPRRAAPARLLWSGRQVAGQPGRGGRRTARRSAPVPGEPARADVAPYCLRCLDRGRGRSSLAVPRRPDVGLFRLDAAARAFAARCRCPGA